MDSGFRRNDGGSGEGWGNGPVSFRARSH